MCAPVSKSPRSETHTANDNFTGVNPSGPTGTAVVYDAWNRMTKHTTMDEAAIDDVVRAYQYDALGRRTMRTTVDPGIAFPPPPQTFQHYYYSTAWQVLHEVTETQSWQFGGGGGPWRRVGGRVRTTPNPPAGRTAVR